MCYQVIKMSYQVIKMSQKMSQSLHQLNINFMQNNMMMQMVGKQFSELEAKFEARVDALKATPLAATAPLATEIEIPPSPIFMSKETIEKNYERAKSLLKRGMPLDRDLMKSCQMTEEEFELLAETMGSE
jgi:hypothetical protein